MGKFFSWLGNLIKSIFNGIIVFFISIWEAFWTILTGIGQFFVDCWEYLWDWAKWAYFSCLDWLLSRFVDFLDLVAEKVGDLGLDLSGIDTVLQMIATVNQFFPVDTVFKCLGIYITVLLVWVVYKFVKSWIPSISGT